MEVKMEDTAMFFGVDYYPEHWPEERWPQDANMMREANINVVRMAEFAWAKMEPEEGTFDFSWLDRAIETLAKEGIKVILGTPTAAAPKWLLDKFPDIYPTDVYGLKKGFGTRRNYCPNNLNYRRYASIIIRKMAEHYKHNPDIIAWQTDNEFGGQCYCESCHKAFHTWLENKYGSVDKLNDEWGTVFWSQTYRSFEEVPLPMYSSSDGFSQNTGAGAAFSTPFNHNPGFLLDFFRFSSDSIVEFQDMQLDIIRNGTSLPVTHNFMGHYSDIDYFNLGKNLDFVSWDNYPNNMWGKTSYTNVAMAHDLMRGIKNKNFWMMEQQSGPCGWQAMGDTPEPGQIRLWTYQALAHGAEAMVYFRWRACTFGIEQYWYGILDHDGTGRRRYREVKEIGNELTRLSELFVDSENRNDTAIIKSYDNFWSHRGQPHNAKFDYNNLLQSYYNALILNNIGADVTNINVDFHKYKLVLMPAFNLMTEEIGRKCEDYVKNGGALLVTFRSGTKSWNNKMTTETLPGYFREMAGIALEEFDSVNFGREVLVKGNFGDGTASMWCDVVKSEGAKPIAIYDSHYYKGTPAITVNEYGKGKVFYIGCDLDETAMAKLIEHITEMLGIEPTIETKIEGLEAVRKRKGEMDYLLLLNHNAFPVKAAVEGVYTEAITGAKVKSDIELPGYGVCILTK